MTPSDRSRGRRMVLRTGAVTFLVGLPGCAADGGMAPTGEAETPTPVFDDEPRLSSPAFADGGSIHRRFTCDGADVSPRLLIDAVPDGTASLALLVYDPDASGGPFTHWLLWGLPSETAEVPEAVPIRETAAPLDGASQGLNDAGAVGYSGPCPPRSDGPHTYRFRLYALASPLPLDPGEDRVAFEEALGEVGHAAGLYRGIYDR